MTQITGPDCAVMCNLINMHTYIHTYLHTIPPWEDQCDWHRMTRMTGPDCAVILPPELSLDMAAIGKVMEWPQERLGIEGISLNRRQPQASLADGVGPEQLTEEQRVAMDTTGLTVVRQGMRVVGVPVGSEQFQRDFLQEGVNGEPAELVRALVPMEDAQASF